MAKKLIHELVQSKHFLPVISLHDLTVSHELFVTLLILTCLDQILDLSMDMDTQVLKYGHQNWVYEKY